MIKKLPLKLTFFLLGFLISAPTIFAQVSLREISLKEQIKNSSLVVEGEVIESNPFWNANRTMIYTSHTVKVYKVFKGEPVETIQVLTKGGIIGLKAIFVSHSLKLGKGSTGMFTLHDSNVDLGLKQKQFKAYSGVQGFYNYDLVNNTATNPFIEKKGIKSSLYSDILALTKANYKTIAPFEQEELNEKILSKNSLMPPSIVGFSPTTITAGTGSVLTITGSGFGGTQGKVGFRNSDASGAPFFDALDSQVLSWNDTTITVEVPVIASNDVNVDGTAGTGTIRVTDAGGSSIISGDVLNISYAEINVSGDFGAGFRSYKTQHHNSNGSGGYTWIMENDFFNETTHVGAPDAFLSAFEAWRCETNVNWEISSSFTNTNTTDTAEKIITFDTNGTSNELPSGTLGTCTYGFSGSNCTTGIVWIATDLDIIFDRETNWYFGTGNITGKFDFETVALHELGHAHQLGHVINTANVMHFNLAPETVNAVLDANSITAGNDVHSRSTSSQSCSPAINPMTDYAGTCGLSVEDNTLESGITLFPNPTKNEFFIKSSYVNIDKVEIYDVRGRLVSNIDISDATKNKTINMRNASQGLYFVNIHSEGRFITKKLILD
ncbi:T9SS type A sorting domain-containing protein [uncultured Algibacter sp.]|uniref:T9SS type A sorting domain-containing protein n=1 Tax=uncultured Algibacter sp. TaxID=298659 RepID=UPI0026257408|nr:T9SS type A sorting domain-containing protein [uncultured Algibacter sp.]